MPAYTPDTIALGIIDQGRVDDVTSKGIVIAIATGLVESNLTMFANYADPESLNFPHDAIGSDANSVGVFQQRAPWWGTCADRMDVKRSAHMFYDKLKKVRPPYTSDELSPGSYAQMVQQSAYPDRYDERMGEAAQIYDRLRGKNTALEPGEAVHPEPVVAAPEFTEIDMMTGGGCSSRSQPIRNWFIHTQEADANAQSLANFCNGDNGVSYHYTVRDGIVCDVVDTDFASWSVLDANVFSINGCFAGSFAGFSRDEWLQRERDIDIMAYLAVQDARKYGFSTAIIAPPYHEDSGISDHKYVTECLGIGTHTDVGDNFPWDVFTFYRDKYTGRPVTARPGGAVGHSLSIYRSNDDSIGSVDDVIWQTNGMVHEARVEALALLGLPYELDLVTRLAAGDESMPAYEQPGAKERAQEILDHIEGRNT